MRVPWSNHQWRRAAVYGAGISGRAAAALLRHHGVRVLLIDDRESVDAGELAADPGVEIVTGGADPELAARVDGVVVSPGVPSDRPFLRAARERVLPVVAEVELAFPFLDGEVIGITGSNGKSTTTALCGAILAAAGREVEVCGNIGAALSSRVEGAPGRVFVVELSSFQLETVDRFRPDSAAILNLSPDHLDRHGDLDGYRAAKARIFGRQGPDDLAVLNADDPRIRDLETTARRRFFSTLGTVEDGCWLDGETVVETAPEGRRRALFERSDLPLPGLHNLENAMAAALLARGHGAAPSHVVAAARAFRGLPHRLELVAERRGTRWYDDSKGTNLDATLRSLEGFADGGVHLILGGRHKGGDLGALRPLAARKTRRVYLIGEAAPEFARVLDGVVPLESAGTLERAVTAAATAARAGEVVLLSPACASFDQFTNFAERGRVFQKLVRALDGGVDGS